MNTEKGNGSSIPPCGTPNWLAVTSDKTPQEEKLENDLEDMIQVISGLWYPGRNISNFHPERFCPEDRKPFLNLILPYRSAHLTHQYHHDQWIPR